VSRGGLLARKRSRRPYGDLLLLLLSATGLALCLAEVAHVLWVGRPGRQPAATAFFTATAPEESPAVRHGQLLQALGLGAATSFAEGLVAGLVLLGGQVALAAPSLLARVRPPAAGG